MSPDPPEINSDGSNPTAWGDNRKSQEIRQVSSKGDSPTNVDPILSFLEPGRELSPELEKEHRAV